MRPSISRACHAAALSMALLLIAGGCSLLPDVRYAQRLHNPFPQLKRVAVLPFYNQSEEPTVDSEAVAGAYYAALQAIPGFEVLPVGVVRAQLQRYASVRGEPQTGPQFQEFARLLGVDAVVVGAVTDFTPYYPPRMALTVHWYAANPGFHPIPPGYGLPWGTKGEDEIPSRVVLETEFELARQQLATQTPEVWMGPPAAVSPGSDATGSGLADPPSGSVAAASAALPQDPPQGEQIVMSGVAPACADASDAGALLAAGALPPQWPDPTGLIPDPPQPQRPIAYPQSEPVLSHTRLFRGNDQDFTQRLADYVSTADDARIGGWQSYLNRSDDFIRFCCHLHVAEMLESRGGVDQSDFILRWPISRYRSQ